MPLRAMLTDPFLDTQPVYVTIKQAGCSTLPKPHLNALQPDLFRVRWQHGPGSWSFKTAQFQFLQGDIS